MAKNLNGVRIERCGLCPNFQTCTHHLFVREKISDACYLPDWTDAPADAHLEKKFPFGFELPAEAKPEPGDEGPAIAELKIELGNVTAQLKAQHEQLNEVATGHSKAMTELFGRVAVLESARDPQEVRGILKDEEWPEVEVMTIDLGCFVVRGCSSCLTRAEAQAVVRAYRWMVARADGHNLSEGEPDARRILKGEGK